MKVITESQFDKATKNLSANELTTVSKRFRKEGKHSKIAFILWALGGAIGLHRFYTGNYGTGLILMAITVFTCGIGALAGLYDVVNIKRLINQANKEIILSIIKDVKRK